MSIELTLIFQPISELKKIMQMIEEVKHMVIKKVILVNTTSEIRM
jgi:hypothetical protein